MSKQKYVKPYMWLVTVAGAMVCVFSAYHFPYSKIDSGYLLLALITVGVSSRLTLKIPRLSSHITVSDTFIFLVMLLYGGEAAILLAAVEGLFSSLRVNKKSVTYSFNAGVMACSTFFTVWAVRLCFGSLQALPSSDYSATLVVALCVMALAQYFFNSGLVAVLAACKIDRPVWQTWKKYYLWTSLTYIAGACAAGIIAKLIGAVGLYAVIITTPILAIMFFTYQTYLKNIEASASQAEQAEQHVEQLSKYIGEIKQAQEERDRLLLLEQEARAEAEHASRIKDEFLATLSHELRTPLTPILGWAELLQTDRLQGPMVAETAKIIERSAQTQKRLIDDLLDVSRIITGKLRLDTTQVDLSSVIEAAIDVVRPAADAKNISIFFSHDAGVQYVLGDAARLQQVVWNLLSNAVKFTPEAGRVEVRLERVASHIRVTVSDTGKGINTQFLPHIFERFCQADGTTTRKYGGLGLGLAIVRHLLELHGGKVHAESPGEGRGSTFTFNLPMMAVRIEPKGLGQFHRGAGTATLSRQLPTLEGLRVLVVDDETDAREMVNATLTQSGAEVRESSSVAEALEVIEEWHPDVLMSDIGMPDDDGYALIRKVRSLSQERGGGTPAAALTAYAREEDRKLALAAGFHVHLSKPVGRGDLINAVAGLAGR